jgi:putative ABC transport system permease protein
MIHWESVIIALFGAILGVVVGALFGWSVVTALADEGIEVLAFPWLQLAIFILAAGFAGVVAAALPALKASRLNVLEAIAYE